MERLKQGGDGGDGLSRGSLRMVRVRRRLFRWRYVVLVAEVAVIAACVVSGWTLLHHPHQDTRTELVPGPGHRAEGSPSTVPIPWAAGHPPGGGAGTRRGQGPAGGAGSMDRPLAGMLSPGLFDHLNHDDLLLYRQESGVIAILIEGVRRYLERQVVPRLLR